MKRNALMTLCFLAVFLVAALAFRADVPTRTEAVNASESVGIDAGYRVLIDPATGRIADDQQGTHYALNPLNRSHEGLEVVPAPIGSGIMVDLQGRFQSTYTAIVDENGKLAAGCDVTEPELRTNLKTEEE